MTKVARPAAGSRAALARLCLLGFLAYSSYAICRTPLLPLFARALGATAPQIGLVVAASTITGILLKLPAGALSDILGRRPLLVAGTIVFATMPFGYLFATSLATLVLLRFIHGSATAIVGPVASASLSDLAPVDRRATWLTTYATSQGIGQALGPVTAGMLIAAGRYQTAFLAAGAIALVTPLLAAGWPSAPAHVPSVQRSRAREFVKGVGDVLAQRQILLTSVTHAAYFMLNGTLTAFLPLFATDAIRLGAPEVGWLFGAQTGTILVIRPLIGAASDRLGRRGVIAAGLMACSGAVGAISIASNATRLFAAVFVYAAGAALTTAATAAYITDVAPRARYGAAHGVFGTIYDIGDAGGPIIAGLMVAAWGYAAAFRLIAGAAAAMAIVFFLSSTPKGSKVQGFKSSMNL